jgi:hypothetical protein
MKSPNRARSHPRARESGPFGRRAGSWQHEPALKHQALPSSSARAARIHAKRPRRPKLRCTQIYIRLPEAGLEAVRRRGKSPNSTASGDCDRIELQRPVYIGALGTWLSHIARAVLHAGAKFPEIPSRTVRFTECSRRTRPNRGAGGANLGQNETGSRGRALRAEAAWV